MEQNIQVILERSDEILKRSHKLIEDQHQILNRYYGLLEVLEEKDLLRVDLLRKAQSRNIYK